MFTYLQQYRLNEARTKDTSLVDLLEGAAQKKCITAKDERRRREQKVTLAWNIIKYEVRMEDKKNDMKMTRTCLGVYTYIQRSRIRGSSRAQG
jgi:hypothetical protein